MCTDEAQTGGQIYTQEQVDAIVEALKPAFETIAEKIREIADWIREVIGRIAAAIRERANAFMDCMLYAANDNPRWWYLYQHAKKARTRKKYRRRLVRQMQRKLLAALRNEVGA